MYLFALLPNKELKQNVIIQRLAIINIIICTFRFDFRFSD